MVSIEIVRQELLSSTNGMIQSYFWVFRLADIGFLQRRQGSFLVCPGFTPAFSMPLESSQPITIDINCVLAKAW
jgi:hypothetical protein